MSVCTPTISASSSTSSSTSSLNGTEIPTKLAVVKTRASIGISAPAVTVEVHLSNGLPGLTIVGLPEAAVRESKERVRSAIINSGLQFPTRRTTINLAPADLPKEGGRYDLPIALGILAASEQICAKQLVDYEFLGELALTGEIRAVKGVLPASIAATLSGSALIVSRDNTAEAALPKKSIVYGANQLSQVIQHLSGDRPMRQQPSTKPKRSSHTSRSHHLDLVDIKGQITAKRALEIAAAGGHSLLLYGPPGTGKTMLAARLPSLLPLLNEEEFLEISAIRSVANDSNQLCFWGERSFRNPHHTASGPALVGGGSNPKPGEISLAHHGVLFLDELPEFSRKVLEVLREPLESGEITISRAARQVHYPAKFQLIAAMNPCPCGYLGDGTKPCQCTGDQIKRYRSKISGPLLDRIDLHVEVPRLPKGALSQKEINRETSEIVRRRVTEARNRQIDRNKLTNAYMNNRDIEQYCPLNPDDYALLDSALESLSLSARSYHRILKIARTIADLDNDDQINTSHLMEALSYRGLDRKLPEYL